MIGVIKYTIKKVLRYFGYELRILPKTYQFHIYDFPDQYGIMCEYQVDVIFDIGSSIGQSAKKYLCLFQNAHIYCFEPFEESYRKLATTFKCNPRVQAIPLAMSNEVASRDFYINQFADTNSLLPFGAEANRLECLTNVRRTSVMTTTVDQFCAENDIQHINILKMDVQGGELLVLEGAGAMLSRQAIDLIFTEIGFTELYHNQPLFSDLERFLAKFGYVLYGLYNLNLPFQVDNAPIWAGDAIFISPKLRDSLSQDHSIINADFGATFDWETVTANA